MNNCFAKPKWLEKFKTKSQPFLNNSRSTLAKLSQAFMLPIAILPFAGLMLGIGGNWG